MGDQKLQKNIPGNPQKRNNYALVCTALASMTSILLGYDVGVMSGAVLFIKRDLNLTDTQVEIMMGILSFYCLIGSTAAGRTSDWIGRRYTIILAAAIFFLGALLMGFAPNYAFLMVGRFVAGIGVGYALMIAPVYTAELSPAAGRGFLSSFPEVFINAGILLGYVSNIAFAGLPNNINWRLMLGIGAVPSVVIAIAVLVMPESPRWLVMQGRISEARMVLAKTSDSAQDAEVRLSDIKEAVGIPKDCEDSDVVALPPGSSKGQGVWREMLLRPAPTVRRILVAAVGLHFFHQAAGTGVVVLYSPRIFEKAGIKSDHALLGATVAVGFTKTMFILVATFLLDRFGRRPLLLASTMGLILSLAGVGTGLTIIDRHPDERLIGVIVFCIVGVLSIVASFSIGLGPMAWVYAPEIIPLRLRAQGMSLAVATSGVTSGVIGMSFISLYKTITIGGTFFLFAGITTLGWVFFYVFLPETRGKTLEEMEMLFVKEKDKANGHLQLGNAAAATAGEK